MTIQINGTTLDNDPAWEDEFKFSPKTGVADRVLDGSVVVQSFDKLAGRPITLVGDDSHGWLKRSTVLVLVALEASNTFSFDVVLRGVTYGCRFRREDDPPLEFEPVTNVNSPSNDFWYTGTIKLITV